MIENEEFTDLVEKKLAFLKTDYGCKLNYPRKGFVRFLSDDFTLTVAYGRNSLEVSLAPGEKHWSRVTRNKSLSIVTIVENLDKNQSLDENTNIRTLEDLADDLDRYEYLLQKYCANILNGDISVWNEVVKSWQGSSRYFGH